MSTEMVTRTFLFTDIEGSTRLLQKVGDRYVQLLEIHRDILRSAIQRHNGKEVHTEGDGFFAIFDRPEEALGAATEAQLGIAAQAWPIGEEVRVRMGIHSGRARQVAGDFEGLAVHRAHRLMRAGHGGQILLSQSTYELLNQPVLSYGVALRDLGPYRLRDLFEPEHIFQVIHADLSDRFPPIFQTGGSQRDPAGAVLDAITPRDADEVQKLIAAGGLPDFSLDHRYSIVFVYPGIGAGDRYPELAGCTAEVCTFADETTEFIKHGFQLVGLSTQITEPSEDLLTSFPFPIGRLPADVSSSLIEIVDREDGRYALRTSFVIFPDGTGFRIRDIKDPIGHVQKCFEVAIGRRLYEYQRATLSYLQGRLDSITSSIKHTGFLASGADSVSISMVDVQKRVVAKMASSDIVVQESGYVDRINRLLEEKGHPRVFPAVVAICADERPAYYLMEAANPLSLDNLLFRDEAMTELRPDRLHILSDAIEKLRNLYEVTFRKEEPEIARYHYLDRFLAIPERRDFKDTFEFLFAGTVSLDEMLLAPFVIDGDFVCHSFRDQIDFLREAIDQLVQPVGAYLHGDVHLKNMLVGEDGKTVVFVDPRIVWDGYDVGDPGFGDPLYDYGTLLHSLHVGSAILRAIDAAETEALLNLEGDPVGAASTVAVGPGLLHFTGSNTPEWFVEWVGRTVPEEVLGSNWQARLHVNTANALFGWLKYPRSVRTRHAWIAIYASVLYHLEAARRYLVTS